MKLGNTKLSEGRQEERKGNKEVRCEFRRRQKTKKRGNRWRVREREGMRPTVWERREGGEEREEGGREDWKEY